MSFRGILRVLMAGRVRDVSSHRADDGPAGGEPAGGVVTTAGRSVVVPATEVAAPCVPPVCTSAEPSSTQSRAAFACGLSDTIMVQPPEPPSNIINNKRRRVASNPTRTACGHKLGRKTVTLLDPVYNEVARRAKERNQSMIEVVNDLLADALGLEQPSLTNRGNPPAASVSQVHATSAAGNRYDGDEESTLPPQPTVNGGFGCSKCRMSKNGCAVCRRKAAAMKK